MKTQLDRFGRLVIPKEIRDHLSLSHCELFIEGSNLIIKAVEEGPSIIQKKGILVYTGESTEPIGDALEKNRKDRSTHLST